ncbi:MAG TPA: protein phosphatase 2C domain-containing protein [Candidatus Saccharimonadales bacterium]|nr:protein phosphatase 2C domain-containing protein [Candidatus Saccharimonadales bacterium]
MPNFAPHPVEVFIGGHAETGYAHVQAGTPCEDSFAWHKNPAVAAAVVGDGLGGYPEGDKASALVTTGYANAIRDMSRTSMGPQELAVAGMEGAHRAIRQEKVRGQLHRKAASTIVANLVDLRTGTFYFGWAGDSGLHYLNEKEGRLDLLTQGHSEGVVMTNTYTGNRAKAQWEGHVMPRYNTTPDVVRLVLASDGLDRLRQRRDMRVANGTRPDMAKVNARITDAISLRNAPTPHEAAYNLVHASAANTIKAGWADDTTVVVMDIYRK